MTNTNDGESRCSFCGKGQSEVKKLIAGPSAYICNECIVLCVKSGSEDKPVVFWQGELEELSLKDIQEKMGLEKDAFLSKTLKELIPKCLDLHKGQLLEDAQNKLEALEEKLEQTSSNIQQSRQTIEETKQTLENFTNKEISLETEIEITRKIMREISRS